MSFIAMLRHLILQETYN